MKKKWHHEKNNTYLLIFTYNHNNIFDAKPYSHHIISLSYPTDKREQCNILKDQIDSNARSASSLIKNIKLDRAVTSKIRKELIEKLKEAREKNIEIPEIEELNNKLDKYNNVWAEMNKSYLNEESIALVLLYNEYCK